MSPTHSLELWFRAVRVAGGRAGLAAGAGPPSLLYNHLNRSSLRDRGLFVPGVLVARPFALSSAGVAEDRIQVMARLSSQPLLEVVQSLFVPNDAGGHSARFRFF
jgi:hypothetical protein